MGAQRTTFEKLQRDRAKKAKAAMKREKRQGGMEDAPRTPDVQPYIVRDSGGELSAAELLTRIEQIHTDLQRGTITQDDFEEQKAELLARLPVD